MKEITDDEKKLRMGIGPTVKRLFRSHASHV